MGERIRVRAKLSIVVMRLLERAVAVCGDDGADVGHGESEVMTVVTIQASDCDFDVTMVMNNEDED